MFFQFLFIYLFIYLVIYLFIYCSIQRINDLSHLVSEILYVLPAFTCAIVIGNLWSIYLGLNILDPVSLIALYLTSDAVVVK